MARTKQTAQKAKGGTLSKAGKKRPAENTAGDAISQAKSKKGKSLKNQGNITKFVQALQYAEDITHNTQVLLKDPDVGERNRCPQASGRPVGGKNGNHERTKRVIKGIAAGYTDPKVLAPSLITVLNEMSPHTRGAIREACKVVRTDISKVIAHLNNRISGRAQECLHMIKFALNDKNLKWEHVSAAHKVVNKIVNMPQMDQQLLDKYMSELAQTGQIQGRLDGHNNASNSRLFNPQFTPNLGTRDQMKAANLPCTSYPTRVQHGGNEFRILLQTNTVTEKATGSNYVNVPGKGFKSFRFFQR